MTTSKQIDCTAYWTAAPHILQQRVIIDSIRGRQRKLVKEKLCRQLKLQLHAHFHCQTLFAKQKGLNLGSPTDSWAELEV